MSGTEGQDPGGTEPIDLQLPRGVTGNSREQSTPQSTIPVTRLIDTVTLLQVTPYQGDNDHFSCFFFFLKKKSLFFFVCFSCFLLSLFISFFLSLFLFSYKKKLFLLYLLFFDLFLFFCFSQSSSFFNFFFNFFF